MTPTPPPWRPEIELVALYCPHCDERCIGYSALIVHIVRYCLWAAEGAAHLGRSPLEELR